MHKLSENTIEVLSSVRMCDLERDTKLSFMTISKALSGEKVAPSTVRLLDLVAEQYRANPPASPREQGLVRRPMARLATAVVPGESAKIAAFSLYGSDEEKIFQDTLQLQKLGFAASRSSVVRAAIRAFDPSKVKP